MSNKTPNRPTNPMAPGPGGRSAGLFYILLFAIMIAFVVNSMSNSFRTNSSTELATSDFVMAVKEGRVSDATYKAADGTISGDYWANKDDMTQDREKGNTDHLTKFTSTYVGTDSLSELMARYPETTFKVDTSSDDFMRDIVVYVVPVLLIAGVMIFLFSRMNNQNGQAMQFGRAKARTTPETRPKVKFSDVAGIDEAVEELSEVRDFLAEPKKFQRMGAKIPRGVLLVGPPGTGKTLLAKAVAGEAGVPFFSISGSDFVEMFVGVGASRVRDLFKQAKEASPSIIFIDEIDAVGRQRGAGLGGGHDEREQTLNQLLVEMDGFEANDAVILIAATNRPDILDPALLRPGRFDRQVTVDRPDQGGRDKILRVHAEGKPLDSSISFEKLAKLTPQFTGADLANLMNEAALLAARRNKTLIGMPEIEEAMERVIAGPERKGRRITDAERTTIAYHESGHALVGHVLDNADPVHKISIISRGNALGYTLSLPEEDHFLQTRNEMLDQIAVLLGGRTAEEIFCDDVTSGASNDLERATKIARNMVTRFGMSDTLGAQVFGEAQHEVFLGRDYADHQDYSADTAKRIDDEVARIMREGHERAYAILDAHRDQMDAIAGILLEQETIEGSEVEKLLSDDWAAYLKRRDDARAIESLGKDTTDIEVEAAPAAPVAEPAAEADADAAEPAADVAVADAAEVDAAEPAAETAEADAAEGESE